MSFYNKVSYIPKYIVKARLTDTCLIRTPPHYGQFVLALGKESPLTVRVNGV